VWRRGKAPAATVRRLQAAGLTVSQTISFPPYARTKGKRTSLRGKRVQVRKKQGGDWLDWREFGSLAKAGTWLGVNRQTVSSNASGVNESPDFQAKFLDMVDDDLPGGEEWKKYTKDTWISDQGRVWDESSGRKYDVKPSPNGYCYFGRNLKPLHHIVAELFLPGRGRSNRQQVDHIDGNPWNNAAANLQWVTGKENVQLAVVRRKQQDVKRSRFLGDKDAPPEEGEKWKPFVITRAMASLDARLAEHVRYDTGWQISNTGRVRDTGGYIRRPKPKESGYRKVKIMIKGKLIEFKVSRLVGFLFLDKPRAGHVWIDHKDQNKGNDRVGNLRWATPAQNRRNRG
jgi:hypothetical protein